MAISVFDLFSIGVGPSSSHTIGPMRAARSFIEVLQLEGNLNKTAKICVDLYGSLALTGKGHATDTAILAGLEGEKPEEVEPEYLEKRLREIRNSNTLNIGNEHEIPFIEAEHLLFHRDKQLPYHPNGMRFTAYNFDNEELLKKIYYSVGGGFIIDHKITDDLEKVFKETHQVPYPFHTAKELLEHCRKHGLTIEALMMENEKSWRSEEEVRQGILHIWSVMKSCIARGCAQEGILPGGLKVRRRAKKISEGLKHGNAGPTATMEWVSLWALAVNEENAAGGRVVTAPTNGSAGVIPSVLKFYEEMMENSTEEGVVTFMLTAAAIGILYKIGASISAAEMGCMGEVGVACSMAAGGLAATMGGTVEQIENAAEIGMEHNLGLTCDPIMGLVQIPCIERNTMGAVKAINAAILALKGDGLHHVSLDQVIATMRETGNNMNSIYKETSLGGLAVNVPEC